MYAHAHTSYTINFPKPVVKVEVEVEGGAAGSDMGGGRSFEHQDLPIATPTCPIKLVMARRGGGTGGRELEDHGDWRPVGRQRSGGHKGRVTLT